VLPRRRRTLASLIGALSILTASAASADEVITDVGLTLNPIIGGVHESFDDLQHVPPVPIPLLEARAQYGPFELDAQGLPAIASVRSFDRLQGHTSTQLSVFEGVARVWDPLHRFSAGIGQTLYNQSTHYTDPIEIAGSGETQFSRVTGLSYQAGYGVPILRGRFEAVFNYAPGMHGTQYTIYNIADIRPRIDPERAEQVDTSVRYTRGAGRHGELIVGLRYVNYTAKYAEPHGGLSDRNCAVLPVFGYRARIGQ